MQDVGPAVSGESDRRSALLQKLSKLMTGKSNKLESKFRLEYRCAPPSVWASNHAIYPRKNVGFLSAVGPTAELCSCGGSDRIRTALRMYVHA